MTSQRILYLPFSIFIQSPGLLAKKTELEEKARAEREEINQQRKHEAQMKLQQQMKKQEVTE